MEVRDDDAVNVLGEDAHPSCSNRGTSSPANRVLDVGDVGKVGETPLVLKGLIHKFMTSIIPKALSINIMPAILVEVFLCIYSLDNCGVLL
jgi:hypothetical protein